MGAKTRYYAALVCALLLSLTVSYAQDTSRQESRKQQLEREIAILDAQLAEISSQSSMMTTNLELLRQNIENRRALVEESNRMIRLYADSVRVKQSEINRLQSRVDTLSVHYASLVKSVYKNRDSRVWYMYILASDNLGQAYRRLGYFKNLSSHMKKEAQKIKGLQLQLEDEKERLQEMKSEAEKIRKERTAELSKLRKDEQDAEAMVQQLMKDRRRCENQVAAKKKEVDALNREIQRIIAEAMRSKSGKGSKEDDEAAIVLSQEFSKNKGKLPWPVKGSLVAKFGKQYHPVFKNLALPPNNGIDIAVSKGESVQAVFNGVVKQVFVMPGYSQCVLIQHGKTYFTFYCKLGKVHVKKGDNIVTGQTIGTVDTVMGQTQLHFELWLNKDPQDPQNWLR